MAWIDTISPEHATGEVAAYYEAVSQARGGVADVHQVQSLNPRTMRAHLELYKSVVFARSTLSRVDRERIAVVVSAANRCPYCIGHHGEALRNLDDDPTVVEALEAGQIPEALGERERALLTWARERTLAPWEAHEAEVKRLRELGVDDRGIFDASATCAYFNFVNRLVLMLGVQLESDYAATCGDQEA